MPLTAEKWGRPPIPLVDPDTKEKIKFRFRKVSFVREISSLPSDLLKLHEMLVSYRNSQNGDTYMIVSVWNKLRVYKEFWASFGFSSEEEYLINYGLPDGSTLRDWTVMVNLFDKATFVLLGDQVLSFMMRIVGQYQSDTDSRKKDYQAIFDLYCKVCDSFDKSTFFDVVRRHVIQKYEEPLAEKAGLSHQDWLRKKNKRNTIFQPSKTAERIVKDAPQDQKFGPTIEKDFTWKERTCPSCVPKIRIIKAFQMYTHDLEAIIRKELGEKYLPEKPEEIKAL